MDLKHLSEKEAQKKLEDFMQMLEPYGQEIPESVIESEKVIVKEKNKSVFDKSNQFC